MSLSDSDSVGAESPLSRNAQQMYDLVETRKRAMLQSKSEPTLPSQRRRHAGRGDQCATLQLPKLANADEIKQRRTVGKHVQQASARMSIAEQANVQRMRGLTVVGAKGKALAARRATGRAGDKFGFALPLPLGKCWHAIFAAVHRADAFGRAVRPERCVRPEPEPVSETPRSAARKIAGLVLTHGLKRAIYRRATDRIAAFLKKPSFLEARMVDRFLDVMRKIKNCQRRIKGMWDVTEARCLLLRKVWFAVEKANTDALSKFIVRVKKRRAGNREAREKAAALKLRLETGDKEPETWVGEVTRQCVKRHAKLTKITEKAARTVPRGKPRTRAGKRRRSYHDPLERWGDGGAVYKLETKKSAIKAIARRNRALKEAVKRAVGREDEPETNLVPEDLDGGGDAEAPAAEVPEDIASTPATPADRLRHAHAARLGVAALEAFLPAASREGFAGKAHDKMRRQDRAKAHFKVALDTLATADQLTHHKSGGALSALKREDAPAGPRSSTSTRRSTRSRRPTSSKHKAGDSPSALSHARMAKQAGIRQHAALGCWLPRPLDIHAPIPKTPATACKASSKANSRAPSRAGPGAQGPVAAQVRRESLEHRMGAAPRARASRGPAGRRRAQAREPAERPPRSAGRPAAAAATLTRGLASRSSPRHKPQPQQLKVHAPGCACARLVRARSTTRRAVRLPRRERGAPDLHFGVDADDAAEPEASESAPSPTPSPPPEGAPRPRPRRAESDGPRTGASEAKLREAIASASDAAGTKAFHGTALPRCVPVNVGGLLRAVMRGEPIPLGGLGCRRRLGEGVVDVKHHIQEALGIVPFADLLAGGDGDDARADSMRRLAAFDDEYVLVLAYVDARNVVSLDLPGGKRKLAETAWEAAVLGPAARDGVEREPAEDEEVRGPAAREDRVRAAPGHDRQDQRVPRDARQAAGRSLRPSSRFTPRGDDGSSSARTATAATLREGRDAHALRGARDGERRPPLRRGQRDGRGLGGLAHLRPSMADLYGVWVGIGRDEAQTLPAVLSSIATASGLFRGGCAVIIYENDSADGTAELVRAWGNSLEAKAGGVRRVVVLSEKLGVGVKRPSHSFLARCRNSTSRRDAVEEPWLATAPDRCASSPSTWICAWASRAGHLYDAFAFRCADAFAVAPLAFDERAFGGLACFWAALNGDRERRPAFPPNLPPRPVDSAFGGLCCYRYAALDGLRHDDQCEDCEHVSLCRSMKRAGFEVLFNPAALLWNADYDDRGPWSARRRLGGLRRPGGPHLGAVHDDAATLDRDAWRRSGGGDAGASGRRPVFRSENTAAPLEIDACAARNAASRNVARLHFLVEDGDAAARLATVVGPPSDRVALSPGGGRRLTLAPPSLTPRGGGRPRLLALPGALELGRARKACDVPLGKGGADNRRVPAAPAASAVLNPARSVVVHHAQAEEKRAGASPR
ncbi:hypothetical protein JL720_16288 [Aureococcus anophagefferens]|nr:hypothetical protein JL720_16288 [Aureococcus anophagefferens]